MHNLKKISRLLKGELKGDPLFEVSAVNSIDLAAETEITFSVKDGIDTQKLRAGALVVKHGSTLQYPNLIYVDEPYAAFATLLELFFPHRRFNKTIDPNAYISPKAEIGRNVSIGAFAYVADGCRIGDNCEIHPGVKIYRDVVIGRNCLIYANVVIREEVEIGDHVVIQPNAVIGADGFGFTRLSDGRPVKIPQKGKVIIGNHCEIGANACIDRSTVEKTILEDYVKLDNLVQIGHNCHIGKGTAMSAQCGISGSVKIGENVIMGGQVGIADHAVITDGVMIAAQAGVSGTIREKGIVAGSPHQDFSTWKRNYVISKNLYKYVQRIKDLEKKIDQLEKNNENQNE